MIERELHAKYRTALDPLLADLAEVPLPAPIFLPSPYAISSTQVAYCATPFLRQLLYEGAYGATGALRRLQY
eukprot:1247655-Rhodomonas_salina.2